MNAMMKLSGVVHSSGNRTLLKAALLERAIAGLLVDSFAYIDEANPIAECMVASTRQQVQLLTKQLSDSSD